MMPERIIPLLRRRDGGRSGWTIMRSDEAFAADVSDEKSEAPRRGQASASQSPMPRGLSRLCFSRRPVRGLTCSDYRHRLFVAALSLGSCAKVSFGNDDGRHCRERPLRPHCRPFSPRFRLPETCRCSHIGGLQFRLATTCTGCGVVKAYSIAIQLHFGALDVLTSSQPFYGASDAGIDAMAKVDRTHGWVSIGDPAELWREHAPFAFVAPLLAL